MNKPAYTKDNLDEYGNHYVATIRIGYKVKHWSSYDFDHLNWRLDQAGMQPFVSGFTIESASYHQSKGKRA